MKPLTDLELEVMKVIWDGSPCTVREVHERLQASRPLAYTTVLTVVGILEQKGHLQRAGKEGRAHTYVPTQERRAVVTAMVKEFVGRLFDGSARPLLLNLAEEKELTQEDLAALAEFVAEKEETP